MRRRLPAWLCVALVALAPGVNATEDEKFTLRLAHAAAPRSTAHTLFLKPWAQRVKAMSGGRLDIVVEPRPAKEAPALLDVLAEGGAELVWTAPSLTPGRYPATAVFELPFMANSAEAASHAVLDLYRRYLEAEYAGLHVILLHAEPPAWLHSARTPLRRLDDLEGKKLFAPTPQMQATVAAWGARPVALATPAEVAAALADGRIDGALMPFATAYPAGVVAATRFHTQPGRPPGLFTTVHMLAMSKARYDALPEDLRRVIDQSAGRDLVDRVGRAWDKVEKLNIKRSRSEGHVFYRLGQAEITRWRIAAQPVIERWIAAFDDGGGDGAALFAAARAAIGKYEVVREIE